MLLTLARKSLLSRKKTVLLTFLSLTISLMVLLSVEHLRTQAKTSFTRTISGTDLIVGAPSGQLNLLLYSVFRLGSPTNNIKYDSYQKLVDNEQVKWAIPISLGDSHKGFRVLGTNDSYFEHFAYGDKRKLTFSQGERFNGLFETVVGADVAEKLNYKVGDRIVVAHGIGSTSFTKHDQSPFVISGVLDKTGTPVDKTVHVSLPAIEAIHLPPSRLAQVIANPQDAKLPTESITAVLVGLNSKFATFTMQRELNNDKSDRLMAILPGVAMTELWQLVGSVENLLRVVAGLVMLTTLFGLSSMLLASMNERQAEIAVFRVLGAGPWKIMLLIFLEAMLLTLSAIATSYALLTFALTALKDFFATEYGLFITSNLLSPSLVSLMIMVLVASCVTAIFPAIEAYKAALHNRLGKK
ncbi:FtsX-like permease family protein [Shewanella sp. WXL01]|uniref:ABC transporter permease n=1 Tax=Shewanella sp. WXL01 TaxID=2709721 RepID=UPI00143856D2|nr:FtsX-like permease family protein [Shewanella sp. WXL01]NKF50267.1 FtsX-like permease family protein [Shewanella sp. WXL01]